MEEFKVIIPKEEYSILEFKQEGFPGIAVVNVALRNFEPKLVFAWHLSLMIDFEDLIENGMPSQNERDIIDPFEGRLDLLLKGSDLEKPNALFLARITWNKTRELIWRVYEPKISDDILKIVIKENQISRQFDYRIESDKHWKLAEWHLKNHKA